MDKDTKLLFESADYLNFLLRTYDQFNKLLTATKNRIKALNSESDPKFHNEVKFAESEKKKLSAKIEKELRLFSIWNDWLKDLTGAGSFIAGNLINLYYFKRIPICKKCDTDLDENFKCPACKKGSKGDGVLKTRTTFKPGFSTVSKWWQYMGVAIVNGEKQKRESGKASNWSNRGRNILWQIGEQFNRREETNLYKRFLLNRKKYHRAKHPVPEIIEGRKKYTDGHINNMAKHEATKLFASHFWTVARHLEGAPVTLPYAATILGHTNIFAPFYYKDADKIQYVKNPYPEILEEAA